MVYDIYIYIYIYKYEETLSSTTLSNHWVEVASIKVYYVINSSVRNLHSTIT